MCLDIDPDSVIHKHLVKKIKRIFVKQIEQWRLPSPSSKSENAYHNLTMLPSFHISLGAPKKPITDINIEKINAMLSEKTDLIPAIGEITLAPINISKKNNKKSAWIPLDFARIIHPRIAFEHWKDLNLSDFGRWGRGIDLHRSDGTPFHRFHISLANLTGNPHDSIARPEDCIIDTITT